MLKIDNIVKSYGKFKAVDGLNIEIENGSIFGFVGPNGAGKSTTMKIMAGLLSADSGSIILNDVDIIKNRNLLKEKIGYMPDFFGVYDNLKVNEYMDFYAGAYKIPYNKRKKNIDNLLELVDLSYKKDSYVDVLSRGMKQRLCLARSLIHDPEVLILDEPASGLDPRARIEMKEILKQLKNLNKTIIISSHILPELSEFCTEIGIINKGKIVEKGSVAEIMSHINNDRIIIVKALNDFKKIVRLLEEDPNVSNIIQNTEDIQFSFNGDNNQLSYILKNIIKNEIDVISFSEKQGNIEDIFMKLTEEVS